MVAMVFENSLMLQALNEDVSTTKFHLVNKLMYDILKYFLVTNF